MKHPIANQSLRRYRFTLCRFTVFMGTIFLLAACMSASQGLMVSNPPQQQPLKIVKKINRPVVALVLGSGAARGFAHVGVINVLDEYGIQPDIVVGSSAGSVVGALYSGNIRGQALVDAAHQLNISQLTDWTMPNRGMLKGELLQEYVNQVLENRPIESLQVPFVAVVTELASGELVALNAGNTGMAVRASSTFPGLIQPLNIGGKEYVDGGIVSPVPVSVAKQMGADIVIAVDVSRRLREPGELNSLFAVMHQAIIIMSHNTSMRELETAEVLIFPEFGSMQMNDFKMREVAVAAGRAAALEAIPKIMNLLNRNDYGISD